MKLRPARYFACRSIPLDCLYVHVLDHAAAIAAAVPLALQLAYTGLVRRPHHASIDAGRGWVPGGAPAVPGVAPQIWVKRGVSPRTAGVARKLHSLDASAVVHRQTLDLARVPRGNHFTRLRADKDRMYGQPVDRYRVLCQMIRLLVGARIVRHVIAGDHPEVSQWRVTHGNAAQRLYPVRGIPAGDDQTNRESIQQR